MNSSVSDVFNSTFLGSSFLSFLSEKNSLTSIFISGFEDIDISGGFLRSSTNEFTISGIFSLFVSFNEGINFSQVLNK